MTLRFTREFARRGFVTPLIAGDGHARLVVVAETPEKDGWWVAYGHPDRDHPELAREEVYEEDTIDLIARTLATIDPRAAAHTLPFDCVGDQTSYTWWRDTIRGPVQHTLASHGTHLIDANADDGGVTLFLASAAVAPRVATLITFTDPAGLDTLPDPLTATCPAHRGSPILRLTRPDSIFGTYAVWASPHVRTRHDSTCTANGPARVRLIGARASAVGQVGSLRRINLASRQWEDV